MKIVRLEASNFKRLRAISIEPDGNVVRITGRNGQGKSSALDAIWAALGGERVSPPVPIRNGEKAAEVNVDLGEILVRRRWTRSGSTIEVTNGTASFKSPQKMLDALVGKLCFDPLAFANSAPADQRASLLGLLGIGPQLDKIEGERKFVFDNRAQVNRDVKALEGQLAGTPAVEAPAEEVSAVAISEELIAAQQRENSKRALLAEAEQDTREAQRLGMRAVDLVAEIESLKRQLEGINCDRKKAAAAAAEKQARATNMPIPDVAEIKARLAGAEQVNAKVRQAKARQALQKQLEAARKAADAMTEQLAGVEKRKTELVAAAPLPVSNLGFGEVGVTFKGVPLEQCAASERLKVSVAVAMSLNPKLKVILVRDASLLDKANLKVLEDLAKARDFQVWLETVADGGKVGIEIEDGEVASVDGVPAGKSKIPVGGFSDESEYSEGPDSPTSGRTKVG